MANLSNINNKFLVTTGGDVGIGVTSPAEKLDVAGDIMLSVASSFIKTTTGDLYISPASFNTTLYNGVNPQILNIYNAGNLSIKLDSAAGTYGGVLLNLAGTNFVHGVSGQGLVLSHHNVGPSNAIVSGDSVNPDNLYINNSGAANDWSNVIITGNVGIATASPSKKLDVQVASGDGIRVSNSTNSAYYSDLLINHNDVSSMQLTCMGTSILQAGNTGNTVLASRTNKDIIITPSGTGNVGIGTTAPAHKLAIEGGADTVIQMSHGSGAVYNWALAAQYITNNAFEIVPSTVVGGSVFTTPVATFKSDGNVGIGTITPSEILHIKDSTNTTLNIEGDSAAGSTFINFTAGSNATKAQISGAKAGVSGGRLLVYTANSSGTSTERMRIDSSGKVGIAITPSAWSVDALQVGQASISQDVNSVYIGANTYNSAAGWKRINAQLAGYMRMGTNDGIWSFSNGITGIADSVITWNERMRIDSSGNVGIATTAPGRKLTIGNGNGFVNNQISLQDGAGTERATISVETTVANDLLIAATSNLRFFTGSTIGNTTTLPTNERMRIDSVGRTIIQSGTLTTPAYTPAQGYPLHVQGIANQCFISIGKSGQTTGSQGMVIGLDTTTSYVWNREAIDISFGTDPGGELMRIKSGGNVGIGTSSPNYKLSVANASTRIVSINYQDSLNTIMSHAGSPNYGLEALTIRGDYIAFYTDYDPSHYQGTEKIRILSGGGITFNGDTAVANALDDYEEGTYSPILQTAGGSAATMSMQLGYYTKIGNVVTVSGTATWSANGSNANTLTVLTLPFSNSSDSNARVAGTFGAVNGIALGDTLRLVVDPGQTQAYVIQQGSNTYSHANTITASGAIYGFSITYRT
jgi:hypothetical protein